MNAKPTGRGETGRDGTGHYHAAVTTTMATPTTTTATATTTTTTTATTLLPQLQLYDMRWLEHARTTLEFDVIYSGPRQTKQTDMLCIFRIRFLRDKAGEHDGQWELLRLLSHIVDLAVGPPGACLPPATPVSESGDSSPVGALERSRLRPAGVF